MKPFDIFQPRVVTFGQLRGFVGEQSLTRFPDTLLLVVWQMGPVQRGKLEVGFSCFDDSDEVDGVCTLSAQAMEEWVPVAAFRPAPTSLGDYHDDGGRAVVSRPRESERRCHEEAQYLADVVAKHVESSTRVSVTAQRGILAIDFDNIDDLERITSLVVPGYAA